MASVFLSYAREDRACAKALARVLEGAGHSVWWDRRLDGGEEFSAEIETALAESDVVLVAWSKESVKSRWVRDEAAVGGDTGRLVPVTIDGSIPPMGFRQFHTLDLTDWRGGKRDERTAELLHSVERRLKGKPATPVSPAPAPRSAPGRSKALWAIPALVLLVIAASVWLIALKDREPSRGPPPRPTIALLPFTTTTADVQLRDLASQARDSVSHTLPRSGIPVRLLSSIPQNRRSAGDFLLSAELSRTADKVVATIRLDEAAQGVTVYSQQFEARGQDIQDLPDRIGARMASMLNGPALLVLDRRHPMDLALMAELLADFDDQLQNYQTSKRVAAKAPDIAMAQIGVAFYTGFVLGDLPREQRPQAVAEARHAAQRALALAPDFGDTYGTWCLLHSDTRMTECEDHLRTGDRIDPDAPYLNLFLSSMLQTVGRFDEAVERARLAYTHDPYDAFKIRNMLAIFEFAGETDEARDLYRQGMRWWPEFNFSFFRNRLYGLVYRGDFEAMDRLEQELGTDAMPPKYATSGPIAAALRS